MQHALRNGGIVVGAVSAVCVAAVGFSGQSDGRLPEVPREPVGVLAAVIQERDMEDAATAAGAALDDFHDAAAKADFGRYFARWTERSVFLGTDATERWVGDEFKEFARPHFEKGKGWTYRPRDRHIHLMPGSELAFFDELLENDKLGVCRGSGVMQKRDGAWKVLQYNLSIPVPNELAERVTGLIRAGVPKPPGGEREREE